MISDDAKRGSPVNYFGVCPVCRRHNGCRSVGPVHWYCCDVHRLKWNVGTNLFSGWRHLTPEQHLANSYKLSQYTEVKPVRGLEVIERDENREDHECPF